MDGLFAEKINVYCVFIALMHFFYFYLTTFFSTFDYQRHLNGSVALSMARLQGYFVERKNHPELALAEVILLAEQLAIDNSSTSSKMPSVDNVALAPADERAAQRALAYKRAARGKLTAAEVDKMVFNPQQGWEKQCNLIE